MYGLYRENFKVLSSRRVTAFFSFMNAMVSTRILPRYTTLLLALAITVLCGSIGAMDAGAQQFGKNKVQYRKFEWKYIQSDHFDIHFYDSAGLNLAKFTAQVSEGALTEIQNHWRYRITNRIAIVIYNSKNDFQQTNVVSEYLPEGVGGVTDLLKNRITVPFEGEWEKFRHVIHHELVHAVLNDKFYGGSFQSIITNNIRFFIPGWMNEGLAEFEAHNGYDIETDMFIRDAVIGEYLPSLEELGGYFSYRGGQAFYWYVEQTYGRDKIGELLNRMKATGDLDVAFRGAFGKNVEEFSEQWTYDLKKIYWPDIADRKRARDFALRLTDHKKDGSFLNTSPSLSPNGDRLAFISDRDGYRSVYVLQVNNPRKITKVAQGEENVDFEELHLLTPAIAWSPDGRRISLAVKSKGRDAIFIIDVDEQEHERLTFDLDAIYSVDWAPDGSKLAFQGINGDHSDIYVYDLARKELTNLTNDIFSDMEPTWANDNRTIYFVSDRRDNPTGQANRDNFLIWNYDYATRDIFSVDAQSMELRRITNNDDILENSPTPGPDGRLLFLSNENGIFNIYQMDSTGSGARPITNSISGIEQLSLTRDAGMVAFTAWNGDGQDIFMMRMPFAARVDGDTLARTTYLKRVRPQSPDVAEDLDPSAPVTVVTPVEGYGDVRIDLADAATVPSQGRDLAAIGTAPPSSPETPEDSRTASGDYAVKDYKVKFTPDIIQATGNYTSFYGIQGITQMLFSDVLGNHQIFAATSLLLDLRNSDFVLSYGYLPEKIDYGVDLFHSSRFNYISDHRGGEYMTRFRRYGLTGHASNPFDRFRRLDLDLSFLNVSREPLRGETPITEQSKLMLIPSLTYVFDNSLMWAFNPSSGSRYNATLMASPKLGGNGVGFFSILGDFRHYIPMSKYGEYSLGLRFTGGASFGPNPQKFFIGGVENWFNYELRDNVLPIENAEDFINVTPVYPLRGYIYNQQVGSRYALGNAELRFPLFRALISGPLPVLFQYVSGVLFIDAGTAWNNDLTLFRKRADGVVVTDDMLLGTGIGARAYVFGFPVRFDVGWNYNLDSWSRPMYYFSFGYDF